MKPYLVIYMIDIAALLFLCGLLYDNNLLSTYRKRSFIYGIILTILVILAEIGTLLALEGRTYLRSLNILFNVLGFAFTPIIPIILIAVFSTKAHKINIFLLLPTMINFITVVLSPMFGLIFYVDSDNFYTRGKFFFVFVAVYIINIIFLMIFTAYACRRSLYPIKGKIISLSVFTLAGSFIQLLLPSVHSSWHCVTLSLFLLYIFLSEFDGSFDALTGLYNRAAYDRAIKKLKTRKVFSVVLMDINSFKMINDTYGHEYGDTVLKDVGAIIRHSFDDQSAWYRIGGDEFCVIRRDDNREKLELQLRFMTSSLTKVRQNNRPFPTVDFGYSIFRGNEVPNIKKILKEADDQIYNYKQLRTRSI